MRKLFIFLWTSLLTTFAFAQQDGWVKQTNKADELLGQKEETLFIYQSSSNKGFLAFREDYKNNPLVAIASLSLAAGNNDSYALDFVNNEMGLGSINVLVGYYIGENLVEKETIKGAVAFKAPSSIMFTDNQGTKIIEHLLSKGSVRFVAPYKSGGHLDLSVPCVSFAPERDEVVQRAQHYLSRYYLSKSQLINQLRNEGFTEEKAIYGAEHCGADWNNQAVLQAKSYLNTSAYSKEGLIHQLFSQHGFTKAEATYGVEHCKADWREQAVRSATQYANGINFTLSKSGLINQLKHIGFTKEEAVYAVEHCDANWKKSACRAAEYYARRLSKQTVINQLKHEGFTDEEISYAIQNCDVDWK